MRQQTVNIIFDKHPPSAKGKYVLTTGVPYKAERIDESKALYTLTDDVGTEFNVSLYGSSYFNNGYWHLDCYERDEDGGLVVTSNG